MNTDELLEHLKSLPNTEVDHAFVVWIEPGTRMPWRDTKKIRECGYMIQDVTSDGKRAKLTIVKDHASTDSE